MYSTIREIHIWLNQRIQQITGNRHRSIAPELLDMVLNEAVINYCEDKLDYKTNEATQGAEQTAKRVDEFRALKVITNPLPFIYDTPQSDNSGFKENNHERGYFLLPGNYLRYINARVTTKFSKLEANIVVNGSTTADYTIVGLSNINLIDGNTITGDVTATMQVIIGSGTGQRIITINIADLIPLITYYDSEEDVDIYPFVQTVGDRLRQNGVDVYWERFDGEYHPQSFIVSYMWNRVNINPFITINNNSYELGITQNFQSRTVRIYRNRSELRDPGFTEYDVDLMGSNIITTARKNVYMNRMRHYSPPGEIIGDRLYVYTTPNYTIDEISLTYYKRPQYFISSINQMTDIQITTDLMESAVSRLLEMLKDEAYQYVKQDKNKH